ncbi:MAG: hypothetical protein R3C10_10935 [Pirellulales bacterium]
MKRLLIATICLLAAGCRFIPDLSNEPVVRNPFPQLSRVAVVPFFNQSTEASVDGREVALAYYDQLSQVPGFEVTPIGVVENLMVDRHLQLTNADDARRLAQVLATEMGVDAVVIGAITDYDPYYPPRMGLRVEWYAANPYYHPIPPGYGLPWGTPAERNIPESLAYEAELAVARSQLDEVTPAYEPYETPPTLPPPGAMPSDETDATVPEDGPPEFFPEENAEPMAGGGPRLVGHEAPGDAHMPGAPAARYDRYKLLTGAAQLNTPVEPVLKHTRVYDGNDADFTTALSTYYYFRDDARFGGWQAYLQRSDDFIRFCCYKHIAEMLTARGGGGESRVVWRWSEHR